MNKQVIKAEKEEIETCKKAIYDIIKNINNANSLKRISKLANHLKAFEDSL